MQGFRRRGSDELASDIAESSFRCAVEWRLTIDIALDERGFCEGQNGFNEIPASSLDRDVQRLEQCINRHESARTEGNSQC